MLIFKAFVVLGTNLTIDGLFIMVPGIEISKGSNSTEPVPFIYVLKSGFLGLLLEGVKFVLNLPSIKSSPIVCLY